MLFKPLAIHVHRSEYGRCSQPSAQMLILESLPQGLREWSVGTLQVVSASVIGLGERNFTGVLRLKIDGGRSATRSVVDRQKGQS